MASRVCLLLVLLLSCGSASWAGHKKKHPVDDGLVTIQEVSLASVTVDAGHDAQESYNITAATTITLDGLPVKIDAIRAGMVAKLGFGADGRTLTSIDAKDAPRVTKKPRKRHTATVVNVKL